MGRPPLTIEVTPKDQKELCKLLSGSVQQVRVVQRALALLQLARGASAPRISLGCPAHRAGRSHHRPLLPAEWFGSRVVRDPGAAAVLDNSQKQRIIAMVCSDPPEGRARWTMRLVAQEAVKRRLIPRVGRETIRIMLLDHDLNVYTQKESKALVRIVGPKVRRKTVAASGPTLHRQSVVEWSRASHPA